MTLQYIKLATPGLTIGFRKNDTWTYTQDDGHPYGFVGCKNTHLSLLMGVGWGGGQ